MYYVKPRKEHLFAIDYFTVDVEHYESLFNNLSKLMIFQLLQNDLRAGLKKGFANSRAL